VEQPRHNALQLLLLLYADEEMNAASLQKNIIRK